MERITIKELVEFRNKSDKAKKSFAYKLKNRKPKEKIETDDTSGGDYWITSTSCINSVFKYDDKKRYNLKIDELHSKIKEAEYRNTKTMHQRNIDILNKFKDFEFEDIKPACELKFLQIPKLHRIITIENFPVYINPSLIYSYEKNGKTEVGALWSVTKLNGFKKAELGMFCEMLYKFLMKNYSENHQISLEHCVVIDTFNVQKVQYTALSTGIIPTLIDKTIKELKEL